MASKQIPDDLPADYETWSKEMKRRDISDQTVHYGRSLASASQMGYDQFLLLRVLWKVPTRDITHGQLCELLSLNKEFREAKAKLSRYKSWIKYCESFTDPIIPESSFALAHHYRREVTHTNSEDLSFHFFTPIAKRTRTQTLRQRMKNLQLQATPSKPSKNSQSHALLRPSDDAFSFPDDVDEAFQQDIIGESTDDEISAFRPGTPMSPGLAKILHPPTKDEQIVNTALMLVLNALTIHFDDISSNWTLHRKAFTAKFEAAENEARTDGYLHDQDGNPQVLLEVKPVIRADKQAFIQVQESAQMVAWIASDDLAAQKAHKT
ncbi:hypothetical protein N7540_002651 [Penicillium herquei]|nr:hypothetical protein N7540_002651 [Penicillium herquei]